MTGTASITRGLRKTLLPVACALVLSSVSSAQQAPSLGYVYPPGGQAGKTVNVQLGGYDWTPDLQFFILDPRVKLEILGPPGEVLVPPPPYWFGPKGFNSAPPLPREQPAKLVIPADVPPGPVRWQVANANGASTTGVFFVGSYPEVLEEKRHQEPQALPEPPVTVSGRLMKIEEVDRYRFTVPKAGPVTCELLARRLGSNFHGVLEVRDAQGRLMADAVDTEGVDPSLTFAAEAGSEYTASVRDLDYNGDWSFVYRLNITPGPRVLAALPAAGRRGETRLVEFVGVGVATGQAKLESVTRQVTFPKEPGVPSLAYRLETPYGTAPAFPLLVSDLPELVNTTSDKVKLDKVPAAITRTITKRFGEEHHFIEGKKGQVWDLAAQARRLGSPLDVSLAVLGPDGKELARSDDLPGTTDAGLQFTVPADGNYDLVVSDTSGKSGSFAAVYRLVVDRPASDFSLQMSPHFDVPITAGAALKVTATRTGDFKEPIALTITGLPPGVSAPANLIMAPTANALEIKLHSAKDAPAFASLVQVIGTAKVGGKTLIRVAQAPAAGNLAPRSPDENSVSTVLVASTLKPRCKVTPVDKDGGRRVHCGATHPAEVIVERLEGFQGEVVLQMASAQSRHRQGITGPEVIVPPGVTRTVYPCFMPEWLETARTSRMAVIGVTKVPDPRGNVRYVVSPVNGQITMSIEGALLKLSHAVTELSVRPGQTISVPVKIARSAKLAEPVKLELRLEDDLLGVLKAEPLTIPAGQSEAVFRVTVADGTRLTGERAFTVRGTALQGGKYPAVSETQVEVEFFSADPKTARRSGSP